VVGAVLVAGHDDAGDPGVGDRTTLSVGLGEHRVHALERPLGDARGLTEPGWTRDEQDLGGDDGLANSRPLVALAQVGLNTRRDVEVGEAKGSDLDPLVLEGVGHDPSQRLGVRGFGRTLERAT
jgi:hypothetical protein